MIIVLDCVADIGHGSGLGLGLANISLLASAETSKSNVYKGCQVFLSEMSGGQTLTQTLILLTMTLTLTLPRCMSPKV